MTKRSARRLPHQPVPALSETRRAIAPQAFAYFPASDSRGSAHPSEVAARAQAHCTTELTKVQMRLFDSIRRGCDNTVAQRCRNAWMHEPTIHWLIRLYSQVATLKLLLRTGWLRCGVASAE